MAGLRGGRCPRKGQSGSWSLTVAVCCPQSHALFAWEGAAARPQEYPVTRCVALVTTSTAKRGRGQHDGRRTHGIVRAGSAGSQTEPVSGAFALRLALPARWTRPIRSQTLPRPLKKSGRAPAVDRPFLGVPPSGVADWGLAFSEAANRLSAATDLVTGPSAAARFVVRFSLCAVTRSTNCSSPPKPDLRSRLHAVIKVRD